MIPYRKVDVVFAKSLGLSCAIVYDYIADACRYNMDQKKKGAFVYEYWTMDASVKQVAARCAISEKTARRSVDKLIKEGYVRRGHRPGTTSSYTVHPEVVEGGKRAIVGLHNTWPDGVGQNDQSTQNDQSGQNDQGTPPKMTRVSGQNDHTLYNDCEPNEPNMNSSQHQDEPDAKVVDFCVRFRKADMETFGEQKRLEEPAWTKKTLPGWIADVERILRIDKVDLRDLYDTHKWVLDDEFWYKQIRTPSKYRRKNKDGNTYYEVMRQKMSGEAS